MYSIDFVRLRWVLLDAVLDGGELQGRGSKWRKGRKKKDDLYDREFVRHRCGLFVFELRRLI